MKRGYLARHTPLSRGEPMQRKRLKRKPARRIAARAALRPYLAYVAQRPCAGEYGIEIPGRGWREHFCEGPIQVMHLGVKPGVGLKCSYLETGAGCMKLHAELDQCRVAFRGLTRDERRAWKDKVIEQTQLDAIPETRQQAEDFANLGLGDILHQVQGTGWAWKPLVQA